MLSWQIGEVKVTRVVEMEVAVPYTEGHFIDEATPEAIRAMPWLYPDFVTEDGAVRISLHALLVETPRLKLVVDTCFGNDKPRALLQDTPLHTDFLQQMANAGFARETVDAVVCTHLHVDHVGWNTMLVDGRFVPTFPNARYIISRAEYEHWIDNPDGEAPQIMADSVRPVFEAGLVTLVELDHRLSPEIRLLPTTGHTPGHVSVLIESEGQTAVITGDMMHHPCQIGRPGWSTEFDTDQQASAVTRRAMLKDWADTPTLVIGTHFATPTAGHIVREGESYRLKI